MTHINHLPENDDEVTEVAFDYEDPTTWPDTSYAGRERDLCNVLNNETMEWYYCMASYGNDDNYNAWALFNMLMVHSAAARAMTDAEAIDDESLDKLIAQIQDDANENSGDYFKTALNYRLEVWTTLQDLTSQFRNQTYSIDDI